MNRHHGLPIGVAFALALGACGKVQEAASEKAAEKMIESANRSFIVAGLRRCDASTFFARTLHCAVWKRPAPHQLFRNRA